MRIYIIGKDGITLCREPPATVSEGEIVVASNEELHAARISGKQLLALWNALPGVEKRRKVGDREALIDQLWSAIELLPDPEPRSDAKRRSMRWRAPRAGSATPCAASSREPSRRSSGSPLPRPKRSVAGSTASPSRRAYEGPSPRRFGSPGSWRAVARSRSRRRPEQPTA
jgi:hypothetical protein